MKQKDKSERWTKNGIYTNRLAKEKNYKSKVLKGTFRTTPTITTFIL